MPPKNTKAHLVFGERQKSAATNQQHPSPGVSFIQPVNLVIMDAVEDIGEVSLRVEADQLGRFYDNHGTRKCFRPSISAREEPFFRPISIGRKVRSAGRSSLEYV